MGWRRGVETSAAGRARAWWHDLVRDREKDVERPRWNERGLSLARPLLRPAPRSAMFFPLVVLAAVLPGLYALNSWDLTPPGPWWGLRGLAVLDGYVLDQIPAATEQITPALESWAFRIVASQPPLYSWLEALFLSLSSDHDPLASVLPSYVAGAIVVVLVYLHGRLWRGAGVGLIAAVLTGFNRNLLFQMQQGSPTTLALAGALGALLCYGWHLRRSSQSSGGDLWEWDGPIFWAMLGGVSLAVSLLSVGFFGLFVIPLVILHQMYINEGAPRNGRERSRRWWISWLINVSIRAGVLTLLVAVIIAVPWHIWMFQRYGLEFTFALFEPLDALKEERHGLLARLIFLAPATLPLGVFGAGRAIRNALADESGERGSIGGAFWVLWLAAAGLLPVVWPQGPWHLGGLFLLIPLNLLAASSISDLAARRIGVRTLTWLAPSTAVTVAWWASATLRDALADFWAGEIDAGTALGLHLAADLVIIAVFLTRVLDRWARRRDDRQRTVLAVFLMTVLGVTLSSGLREVQFRHRETEDLLMLRTMILRRDREMPFTIVAVVGPEAFRQTTEGPMPGGRLRFILRSALPHLNQIDLPSTDDLMNLPEGKRLVILAGSDQRLPSRIQSRLKLEAIHPGRIGVLDAFATAHEGTPPRR